MGGRNGLSRRQLLGAIAGAGVRAALGLPTARAVAGQGASGAAVRTTEELVFVNGRIHTMDGNNTIGGFHRNQLFPRGQNPRLPTLAELDTAAPDHPVYISESFMGPSATNSLGKGFFKRQTPPVPVGEDGSIATGSQSTGRATLA